MKTAMPARRAVSLNAADWRRWKSKANSPAQNAYTESPRAITNAKVPKRAMRCERLFFQMVRATANEHISRFPKAIVTDVTEWCDKQPSAPQIAKRGLPKWDTVPRFVLLLV